MRTSVRGRDCGAARPRWTLRATGALLSTVYLVAALLPCAPAIEAYPLAELRASPGHLSAPQATPAAGHHHAAAGHPHAAVEVSTHAAHAQGAATQEPREERAEELVAQCPCGCGAGSDEAPTPNRLGPALPGLVAVWSQAGLPPWPAPGAPTLEGRAPSPIEVVPISA